MENSKGMSIAQFMDRLGNGQFNQRFHETLALVSDEVLATGKQGSVNITLKLSCPDASAQDPVINISPTVKPVLPPRQSAVTSLYHYEGDFHRSPKSQDRFPEGIYDINDGAGSGAKDKATGSA